MTRDNSWAVATALFAAGLFVGVVVLELYSYPIQAEAAAEYLSPRVNVPVRALTAMLEPHYRAVGQRRAVVYGGVLLALAVVVARSTYISLWKKVNRDHPGKC